MHVPFNSGIKKHFYNAYNTDDNKNTINYYQYYGDMITVNLK